jgi:succinyl-CoA---D-citramalate CoA-transferase
VTAWTSGLDVDDLDAALTDAGVPHGLIYRAPDILDDDHYKAREMVRRVYDAALGRDVPMPDVVPRLTRTPGQIRWAGAPVGAHTHDVLAELGLSDEDRRRLAAADVIPPA